MRLFEDIVLSFYKVVLYLYPKNFRRRYAVEMVDAVRLSLRESNLPVLSVIALAGDTAAGVVREHLRAARTSAVSMMFLAGMMSCVLVMVAVVYQQILRHDADRSPQAMVASLNHSKAVGNEEIALPENAAEIAAPSWLASKQTFAAVYNDRGDVVASNATLHGALPQPPRGIFQRMRERGLYKVTWQPANGIRVALVGEPVAGGGFLVAGQSLIHTETSVIHFHQVLLWIWAGLLAAMTIVYAVGRRQTV